MIKKKSEFGVGVRILVKSEGALNITDSRIIPPNNESYDKKGISPEINL